MPYQTGGYSGLTVSGKLKRAPRAPKLPRASAGDGGPFGKPRSSGRRKAPCKYGARIDGRCPPAPKQPLAIPRTLNLPEPQGKKAPLLSREEKQILGLAGLSGRRAIKRTLTRTAAAAGRLAGKTVKGQALRAAARAGGRGAAGRVAARIAAGSLLGAAAIAGLAAYYVTTMYINRKAKSREQRAQNAFEVARASRALRLDIEARQGRPLTPEQRAQMQQTFRAEMTKIGIPLSDIGGRQALDFSKL